MIFYTQLDNIEKLRREGNSVVTIDLTKIDDAMFNAEGPAYRLLEAMKLVLEHESYDGYRGAPRLIYVLLWELKQINDLEKGE